MLQKMTSEEKDAYEAKLKAEIERLTKEIQDSGKLTGNVEAETQLKTILDSSVTEGDLQGLIDKANALQTLLNTINTPPKTEDVTAADGITEIDTAMVEAGKEAETFEKTLVDTMQSIAEEAKDAAAAVDSIGDA